ncbi:MULTISPECIES: transketolase family protein [Parabacteroides]|jgi:transketolase|uniref:transketolase n=4 Tax=Parabacteroides goldsteinii TaxID=328812 RepID=A0A6G1ZC75_9BACT|nr:MULTISPECIES: transketolase [Parabacteroides]EOS19513.1 transketolase [Parabacteroides goldsteinii dnLKV18]KAI4360512.1 Transketolase [Parabacteroides sp. ASF519]MBF0765724.1 transketolase [Parabacteroides goldsteinii]MDZ3929097.1 transketolase [Parabacteroides goldsteinii]MRX91885.1 transketolase [Parabacteroides goldsteinii]
MNDIKVMNRAADNIRVLAASMVEKAKSGHPGGAMGGADFINVLFSEYLVYDPKNPEWEGRDRYFQDPGHMSPMLYSALALTGKFTMEELSMFRQWGSPTPGHPEVDIKRGIENTSGPLGQGHTYAVGAAIAAKFLKARLGDVMNQTIYAYISDGGIQEEISQGAGRVAGTLGLDNLIMFYDSNNIQLSTTVEEVTTENVAMKYEAWGWKVISINGNDVNEIRKALDEAKAETQRPTLIIGDTIMGKGAMGADKSNYENKVSTHGQPLSAAGASIEETIKNLGGDPQNPFSVFPEVAELYAKRAKELEAIVAERYAAKEAWAKANPELAEKMKFWFSGKAPKLDWEAIEQKANQATRAASATVLGVLATKVENMICSSADLSNSDKTDGFLKKTHSFVKGDFSGAFFQAGVSELTMACVCIGMSLHGGVIVACGTFFVFSDYMKPAIRMAALMEQPVKFIWSHDAFRVGEDGPTHEPVEQEAQIRLMEKLKNHKGHNSMLVLRPADVIETTVAWKMAMENTATPTALILSRQNITDLPSKGNRYNEALQAEKGAYIVESDENPDVIMVASGSEVATLEEGAALLRADGVKVRVVSVPSEGLFRSQSKEYQESVIPTGSKIFGLTAGLPVNLEGLVGANGKVWGLESFGFSAPYKVLDEKLGFTGQNVYNQVKELLA